MNEFFRFPHTAHLSWLGAGSPRDDKVLSPAESRLMLAGRVTVEEKLDGANVGFSVGPDGCLRAQNRGQYLAPPYSGQFSRLATWMRLHEQTLSKVLGENLMLFGEWCAARHSLDYTNLSDWFIAFDVYDARSGKFWSSERRNKLVNEVSIALVPLLFKGKARLSFLKSLIEHEQSRFRSGVLEGIIVRKESADWLDVRAKLVHPDFTQHITEHWRRRGIEWNRTNDNILLDRCFGQSQRS